jgi:outer membrane cobalamin receptor
MQKFFLILFLISFLPLSFSFAKENELSNISTNNQQALPKIIVTTKRYVSVQPNSIELSEQDLLNYKDATLPEILDSVPGIQVKRYGSKGSQASISLHGADSKHTLIMLNGMPIKNPIYGSVDFNQINLEDVERIEIFKSGMSAIYGSDAVGGVINIITKKPENKTIVKLGYGSFEDRFVSLENAYTLGLYSHRLNVYKGEYTGFRPYSYFNKNSLSGDFDFIFEELLHLNLYISTYFYQRGNPGSTEATSLPSEQENNGFDFRSNFYFGKQEQIKFYFAQKKGERKRISGSVSDSKYVNKIFGYMQSFQIYEHDMVAGYEQNNTVPEDATLTDNVSILTQAFFINDKLNISPTWKLNIGLRTDHYSEFSWANTYKISSAWQVGEVSWIKTSIGSSFRAPTLSDLYYQDAFSIGNPNLLPETASNLDLEFSSAVSKSIKYRLSYFYKDVKNLIQWAPLPSGVWTPQNIGQAKLSGGALGLDFFPTKKLKCKFNLTYLADAWALQTNKWLKYRPKHTADFLISYSMNPWQINTRLNFVSSRASKNDGQLNLPDYWTADFDYSWEWLSLYVHNVFNFQYEEILNYPMPGRTAGVKVSYEL